MQVGQSKQSQFVSHQTKDLAEYMLVIEPGSAIIDKVLAERDEFKRVYGQQGNDNATHYIKLARFDTSEEVEGTLIRWIERICRQFESFELTLNNYGGFPEHSIYLRIQDKTPFSGLFRQLQVIDSLLGTASVPCLKLAVKPHLVLCNGLSPETFRIAMPDYAQRTFHESFTVSRLMLVRVDKINGTCKLVNVFGFAPPVAV